MAIVGGYRSPQSSCVVTTSWHGRESIPKLVGGFNPFEKLIVELDHFPQVGVKIKKCLKPPASKVMILPFTLRIRLYVLRKDILPKILL